MVLQESVVLGSTPLALFMLLNERVYFLQKDLFCAIIGKNEIEVISHLMCMEIARKLRCEYWVIGEEVKRTPRCGEPFRPGKTNIL